MFGKFALAIVCASMLALSGCISYTTTSGGSDDFRDAWKDAVPAADVSDTADAWDAFEAGMKPLFAAQRGVMTLADAEARFGRPLLKRTTMGKTGGTVSVASWYVDRGNNFTADLFIVNKTRVRQHSYAVTLSFNEAGRLFESELTRLDQPSSSFGYTTQHVVETAAPIAITFVVAKVVERMLDRVSDHFTGNLQGIADGLPSKLESAAEKGVKNGGDAVVNDAKAAIKTDVTTKGGTVSGSVAGKPFSVTVPSFSGSVR